MASPIDPELLKLAGLGMKTFSKTDDPSFNDSVKDATTFIPLNIAREQVEARSVNIMANFDYLRSLVPRHYTIIERRWKQKTKEERRKILLTAWGGPMSQAHRPDIEAAHKAWRFGSNWLLRASPKHNAYVSMQEQRDAFVWPYINQEDLTTATNPLQFICSRAKHSPPVFLTMDFDTTMFGRSLGAILPFVTPGYAIVFRRCESPDSYAELLPFEKPNKSSEKVQTKSKGCDFGVSGGFVLLEAQDRLMTFLVHCVDRLLLDVADKLLVNEQLSVKSAVEPSQPKMVTSLAETSAEAAYRVPSLIDLGRMKLLLAAKRDESADHLWALREDAGYFDQYIREVGEHRPEMLKDIEGRSHPMFRNNRQDPFWDEVLKDEIETLYISFEQWSDLHEQSEKLEAMRARLTRNLRSAHKSQTAFRSTLMRFWLCLIMTNAIYIRELADLVSVSPPWRRLFREKSTLQLVSDPPTITRKLDKTCSQTQDRILWVLKELKATALTVNVHSSITLLDDLQRSLCSNKTTKDLSTALVATKVADISIKKYLWTLNSSTFFEHILPRIGVWRMIEAMFTSAQPVLAQYGAPNPVKFLYPVHKQRTKETVQARRLAEENLDKFWNRIDRCMHLNAEAMRDTAVYRLFANRPDLYRTPEWVQPIEKYLAKAKLNVKRVEISLAEMHLRLQERTERTLEQGLGASGTSVTPKVRRRKEREKRTAYESAESVSPQVNDATEFNVTESRIVVNKRALRVFRSLFFAQSHSSTPGQIAWVDFLHAMVSAGFKAEKLYGSVWQFEPMRLDVKRGIQFHEPHPSTKIAYLIARRIGRRLSRAYGWDGDTFVLADKTEDDGVE